MKKLTYQILNGYILFYISLIWLVFPLYFAPNILAIILAILMAVAIITILHINNKVVTVILWLYMCFYIFYSVYHAGMSGMMFMYLSSIIAFKFRDTNITSFFNISYYLLFTLVLAMLILKNISQTEKLIYILVMVFLLFMHITFILQIISEDNKEKLFKKNQYINNLIVENERNRIGRDLHDTLGHVFATLTLKSELAIKYIEKEKYDFLKKELEDINNATREAMQNVRQIVQNLKYVTIKEELNLIQETLDLADIKLTVEKNLDTNNLNPTLQSTCSMIIREAINNILKHSSASSCKIIFSEDNYYLKITFEDDGIGFDKVDSNDLKSIKDRLILVKGSAEIVSTKNPTKIAITIPYERI